MNNHPANPLPSPGQLGDTSLLEVLRTGYGPLDLEQTVAQPNDDPNATVPVPVLGEAASLAPLEISAPRQASVHTHQDGTLQIVETAPGKFQGTFADGQSVQLDFPVPAPQLNTTAAGEGDPQPSLQPEISGHVPVYSDGRINVRNTPDIGWSLDTIWQGQRAWVPFDQLPRSTLGLIALHLAERQYFPYDADRWAETLLGFTLPHAPVVQRQQDGSLVITPPAGPSSMQLTASTGGQRLSKTQQKLAKRTKRGKR